MPRKGQRQIDIPAAQTKAQEYTLNYLRNTALGLPELTDADFERVMNAITRAMVNAYAAGYLDARGV